jgi:hypothetical protein
VDRPQFECVERRHNRGGGALDIVSRHRILATANIDNRFNSLPLGELSDSSTVTVSVD